MNTNTPAQKEAAIQEGERITAADEYFAARTWIMDTNDNRRIFEAGFDRAYALLSKLRAEGVQAGDEDTPPIAPADEAISECWITASDCDGIAYDGPSFERGYCAALASAPVADERARKALSALVEQWDKYKSTEYQNQEDAYYRLDKYAYPLWKEARAALASAPVAEDSVSFEEWFNREYREAIARTDDLVSLFEERRTLRKGWDARAALASAPVAGEVAYWLVYQDWDMKAVRFAPGAEGKPVVLPGYSAMPLYAAPQATNERSK